IGIHSWTGSMRFTARSTATSRVTLQCGSTIGSRQRGQPDPLLSGETRESFSREVTGSHIQGQRRRNHLAVSGKGRRKVAAEMRSEAVNARGNATGSNEEELDRGKRPRVFRARVRS